MESSELAGLIRDIPDFPEPGVVFKDITPLLAHPDGLEAVVGRLASEFGDNGVDKVAGIEARGFILATPIAMRLGAGFVPVRKPGKLPYEVVREEYALEYGTDALEIHRDAVQPGDRVLIIDDVLATGGTAAATVSLLRHLGAEVLGVGVLVELEFLEGRSQLADVDFVSLVQYDGT